MATNNFTAATISECLKQLEFCEYQTEAGPITMNVAFQRLKWLSQKVWRVSTFSDHDKYNLAFSGDRNMDTSKIEGNIAIGVFRGDTSNIKAYVASKIVYECRMVEVIFNPTDVTHEMAVSETARLAKIADLKAQLKELEGK